MVGFALVWGNALKAFGGHVEYIHLAPNFRNSAKILYKKSRTKGPKWTSPPRALSEAAKICSIPHIMHCSTQQVTSRYPEPRKQGTKTR